MKKKTSIILHTIFIVLSVLLLFPVLYAVIGSFKSSSEVLVSSSILPEKWTLDGFEYVFLKMNFLRYTVNSTMVTVIAVIARIIITSMCAYVLSRMEFKAKKYIFVALIAAFFVSLGVVGLLPVFILMMKTFHLNGLIALVINYIPGDTFAVLILYSYMQGIKKELDEAANIDGCSLFRTYRSIIMPIMLPALSVVGLLAFMQVWNDYLTPLVYTGGSEQLKTLTVAVTQLKSSGFFSAGYNVILAASVISLTPILVVYLFANKYFISGLTAGAVKM